MYPTVALHYDKWNQQQRNQQVANLEACYECNLIDGYNFIHGCKLMYMLHDMFKLHCSHSQVSMVNADGLAPSLLLVSPSTALVLIIEDKQIFHECHFQLPMSSQLRRII